MRAKEFVADFEGINIAVEEEEDDLMLRARSGGREMGHAYFVKDGRTLLPQDLEIDPRYQGQGIARVLYDYAKSLGYEIRRSNQQTDAGKAFWQRNRPGQNVWEAETKTATGKQVLDYINSTHHEPLTVKLDTAVLTHPQWQLKRVPLMNLNIPDEEYDDVEQEPEADPYGRVMAVDPAHAGKVSQQLIDKKPIVIDANRYIIDGNHRAWAAKYLLNRDYIMAWVPVEQLVELNYPDELNVSDALQQYFVRRGYQVAGEGRDQIAFESPRGTVVKVLGIGEQEREDIVKRYVKFFLQHQRNPYYPRIYNTGNFTVGDETYFVYEMEYLNYIADEEEVLEYIEDLMSAAARGPEAVRAYQQNRPLPKSLPEDEIQGLLQATYELEAAIGGLAPLDLSMIENIRRRANGHIVIMDPYSL
jgi:hypothetical protein